MCRWYKIGADGCPIDFSGTFSTDEDSSSNEESGTLGTPPIPPSFASLINDESSKRKVNFRTLETGCSDNAEVLIPMMWVLEEICVECLEELCVEC